jgi:hypothetical protein
MICQIRKLSMIFLLKTNNNIKIKKNSDWWIIYFPIIQKYLKVIRAKIT